MSLTHEATQIFPGYKYGDFKIAHYPISYTAGAITIPAEDPRWMLLNGVSLSTTAYPKLFALFGYAYGGSGGNFNLPDMTEGKIPIARGLSNFTALGASGGTIEETLDVSKMPSHGHDWSALAWTASPHSHSSSAGLSSDDAHAHTMGSTVASGTTRNFNTTGSNSVAGYTGTAPQGTDSGNTNHYHGGTFTVNSNTSSVSWSSSGVNYAGGSGGVTQPHNNMQPYIVVGGWLVMYG